MALSLAMKSCFILSLLMKLEMSWIPDQVAKQRKRATVRFKCELGVLPPWYMATAIFPGQICGSGGINSPHPLLYRAPWWRSVPIDSRSAKDGLRRGGIEKAM